jgi:hypothetical protein
MIFVRILISAFSFTVNLKYTSPFLLNIFKSDCEKVNIEKRIKTISVIEDFILTTKLVNRYTKIGIILSAERFFIDCG